MDNVVRPWPFDRPACLGSKLVMSANYWQNSSSENVGHRQSFIAEAVLLGKVFVWLPKGIDQYLREKRAPIPVNTEAVREYPARNREWSERVNAFIVGGCPKNFNQFRLAEWSIIRRCSEEQQTCCWVCQRSKSNRRRLSVCKGTWEAQPSMEIARIGRRNAAESSPMRRLSGGAPVVVRGREGRLHGEGVQESSFWTTQGFFN